MTRPKFFPGLAFLAMLAVAAPAEARTIRFAGLEWNVRGGSGGPGPNRWSDDENSVWGDAEGRLHLKIRKVGATWYCSEVWTRESLGYGDYIFQVASNVEAYDPNVVAGLFTYLDDTHEIDIEFSRWGNPKDVAGQFVVQPYRRPENIDRFELGLQGDFTTHHFRWEERSVAFRSVHGHVADPAAQGELIRAWTCTSRDIPKAGREKLHINLWLNQGKPPADGKDVELILKDFRFKRD